MVLDEGQHARNVGRAAAHNLSHNHRLLAAALEIIEPAEHEGLTTRLLGGLAIAAHATPADTFVHRPVQDVDLYVTRKARRDLARLIEARGYEAEPRFNALNGHRRMLFHGDGFDIDVLVGEFDMCHRLDFEPRLTLDYPTLPVADLLLTKLQVIQLNEKDATDARFLLEQHELGTGPGDHVDVDRVLEATSADWGLWRTVHLTSETVLQNASPAVTERVTTLLSAMDDAPKSMRWRTRARLGDRVRWYQLPEEVGQ